MRLRLNIRVIRQLHNKRVEHHQQHALLQGERVVDTMHVRYQRALHAKHDYYSNQSLNRVPDGSLEENEHYVV